MEKREFVEMKWRGSKCDDLIMEVEGKFVY